MHFLDLQNEERFIKFCLSTLYYPILHNTIYWTTVGNCE